MKSLYLIAVTLLFGSGSILAQDDETRRASGLPMQIGENIRGTRMNVSGRVTLETGTKLARLPVIVVIVKLAGVNVDKAIANDKGYYVISNVPRENINLIVEIDGNEVVMQPLVPSPMGNPRFDVTIPWPSERTAKPGVVNAGLVSGRSEKSEKMFQEAVAATKANQASKAVELFNDVLSADPKDFAAWTELGTLYFRAGKHDDAEACYFKALEVKKDFFVALLNLGKLYVKRDQHDNAILALSNAVAADPASADARHLLGESYLAVKKGSLAVPQLNEAIKLAPKEKAEIHLRLAALYDSAGMKGKASTEYQKFIEKTPGFADRKRIEKYIADNPPN